LCVLAGVTRSGTERATLDRLQGHTVQYDECGNVIGVDNRAIASVPVIYFFVDGLDINGEPDEYTDERIADRAHPEYQTLAELNARPAPLHKLKLSDKVVAVETDHPVGTLPAEANVGEAMATELDGIVEKFDKISLMLTINDLAECAGQKIDRLDVSMTLKEAMRPDECFDLQAMIDYKMYKDDNGRDVWCDVMHDLDGYKQAYCGTPGSSCFSPRSSGYSLFVAQQTPAIPRWSKARCAMVTNGDSLINKAHVRSTILRLTRETRTGWDCQRVAACVFDDLDQMVRMRLVGAVKRHPAIGKTFKELQ
jgi:hypothetical protein